MRKINMNAANLVYNLRHTNINQDNTNLNAPKKELEDNQIVEEYEGECEECEMVPLSKACPICEL